MDERERHKRKERSNTIWTFLIVGAFLMAWPIGLILAILKGKNLLPDIGMNMPSGTKDAWENQSKPTEAKDWSAQLHRQTERAHQQAQQAKERTAQWAAPIQKAKKQLPKQEQKKKRKLRFGKPMFITGLCISGVGLIDLVETLPGVWNFDRFWKDCFFPCGLLCVGIYLTVYGILRMRQSKRLQEYATLLSDNGSFYAIAAFAERTGHPYRQVLADLQKMVELGIWQQAWIDRKNGRLMFTPYAAEPAAAASFKEAPAEPQKENRRAEQVLQRIRADNDLIEDAIISQKIDRIELLTGEIFRYVAKHPEREGELRTFMDYYLPQTLKILETYAQLEAQGVETDNIRKAKNEISAMLDQLSESYERQLDKLFDTDVLDISADIEVMRQMLRSDGLSPDALELLRKKQT